MTEQEDSNIVNERSDGMGQIIKLMGHYHAD